MALHAQITDWIVARAADHDLQVMDLQWPSVWAPGFAAMSASIKIGSTTYVGNGIDLSPDIALIKAVVEAIEHSVKDESGLPTSSGLAGHVTTDLAAEHALCELIERDAFFCHFLTKTPFLPVANPDDLAAAAGFDWSRVVKVAGVSGIKLHLCGLQVPKGFHGVVCLAMGQDGRPFGVILGLGCQHSQEAAFRKAVLECIWNVAAAVEGNLATPLALEAFATIEVPAVLDHLRLGLTVESATVMRRLIVPSAGKLGIPMPLSGLKLTKFLLPTAVQSAPLNFVQASSPHAQSAYFGHVTASLVNLDRLSGFTGGRFSIADLEFHPHVMG